ncbi:hypothetical protein CEXT_514461 [Caerostris extrusa]|uniref:Uncharacterized protein n=1 Tax=Caerostris extrusa TaxID=172846 RepID=A0AAV4T440_CAEEX|nr:hypothetical protein CEXT_514461 [Caerostris extrusa]
MAVIFPLYLPGHSETRIDLTLEQCWVSLFTPPRSRTYRMLCSGCQFHPHPISTEQQSSAFQNQRFARRISVLVNRISMKLGPQAQRRQPGRIYP